MSPMQGYSCALYGVDIANKGAIQDKGSCCALHDSLSSIDPHFGFNVLSILIMIEAQNWPATFIGPIANAMAGWF